MVSMRVAAHSDCSLPARGGGLGRGKQQAQSMWLPPPQPSPVNGGGSAPSMRLRLRSLLWLLLLGLHRILHGVEGGELDIVELAVDLLDLADVDVLHDVARVRIDRDRAARAFPLHALHG